MTLRMSAWNSKTGLPGGVTRFVIEEHFRHSAWLSKKVTLPPRRISGKPLSPECYRTDMLLTHRQVTVRQRMEAHVLYMVEKPGVGRYRFGDVIE